MFLKSIKESKRELPREMTGAQRGEEIGPWVAWEGGWWGESSGEG